MPYRVNVKDKLPLFYVHIGYRDPKNKTDCTRKFWLRAKDSYQAFVRVMKLLSLVPSDVWDHNVISRENFNEKEQEIG